MLLFIACAYEGDEAGECRDGADNDRDSYFDCDDHDCSASPDCVGDSGDSGDGGEDTGDADPLDSETEVEDSEAPDSDSPADSGDGGDSGDSADETGGTDSTVAPWSAVQVSYTLSWDFDDAYEVMLESYGLGDCSTTYEAVAEVTDTSGSTVHFYGSWGPGSYDCAEDLVGVIWYDDSGESWLSLQFTDNSWTELDTWIQHRDEADSEPLSDPYDNGQWYIFDMFAAVESGAASHAEEETTTIEGIIPVTLTHAVEFSLD